MPKLDFEAFPWYSSENLSNKNKYQNLWDGTLKKTCRLHGGNLFFSIGGWTHCFTIPFSYWFSITTLRIPLCPTKKKGSATPILFFSFGYGSIPIHTIFRGMNIHLPAILMFTRGTRFWLIPIWVSFSNRKKGWLTSPAGPKSTSRSVLRPRVQYFVSSTGYESEWKKMDVLFGSGPKNMGCISYKPTNLGYTLYFPCYFDMNGILFWPAPSVTWDPFGMRAASASELSLNHLNQLWKIPKVRVSKITKEQ